MKRSAALRRTTRLRPVSARRRRQTAAYQRVVAHVFARARGRCEVVMGLRCSRSALDPHHVMKRSAGGALADPSNIIAVCRHCHRMTDNEFRRGRLVITSLGNERFSCFILFARDKFAVRRPAC